MSGRQRLSLKGQALKYLSMREHSRLELRRKMLPHARLACKAADESAHDSAGGVAASDADDSTAEEVGPCLDKLLTWLEDNGLLSEERFVESRVRTRAARFGTSRIKQELSRHGVDLPVSLKKDLEASEVERARLVWARKFENVGQRIDQPRNQPRDQAGDQAGDHTSDRTSDHTSETDDDPPAAAAPTADQRARQMRFLAARGFSSEAVRKVVWGSRDQPTSDDETAD